ncbi:MAG: PEP-CTERM sorting domain-containing protein [Betaproteobacteria bacterium]
MLLLTAAAAQGAIYSGRFDPTGTAPDFPGFTGEALFTIDDGCVALGDGYHYVNASNGCGDSFMTSATVNLFDPLASEPLLVGDRVDSFSLAGHFDLAGVLISGGQVTGVDTDIVGPAFGAGYPTHWTNTTPFWLQFVSGCLGATPDDGCFTDPAFIYMGDTQNQSKPATVTFERVPEPGTLALVLGAIGLGWLLRRRDTSQPTRTTAACA